VKQFGAILIFILTLQVVFAQSEDKSLGDFFGKKAKTKERAMLKSSFTKKSKQKERGLLKSPFSRKERLKKENKPPLLPDFYAKAVGKMAERSQMPSFFNRVLEKEKERTLQPDFFTKGIFKTKRIEPGDYFSSAKSNRKRGLQADHFSSANSGKEHNEDDVTSSKVSKKRVGKKFIGERFRLFTQDPNKKTKPKKSNGKKDPFWKKKRDADKAQSPRNEMDLFQGGVLPKMKDMR